MCNIKNVLKMKNLSPPNQNIGLSCYVAAFGLDYGDTAVPAADSAFFEYQSFCTAIVKNRPFLQRRPIVSRNTFLPSGKTIRS